MRNRMPPMRALRDFEAVGRHGSLSAAARELAVTPAAISRQIALLERHFGCSLFSRHRRGLTLTNKGSDFFETIRDAFDRIDDASANLLEPSDQVLSIRVYTGLATEWLIPRLGDFRARFPNIELHLTATAEPINFETNEIDIAIVPDVQRSPRLRHDVLFDSIYFPVCSPALLESGAPLLTPQDLKHHTLLYSRRQIKHWHAWFEKTGVTDARLDRGILFESSPMALRAARDGAGVALGKLMYVTDDLIAGRMVAPFVHTVRSDLPYFVVCVRRRANTQTIAAFRNWLIAQVHDSDARAKQLLKPGLLADAGLEPGIVQA